MIAEMAYQEPSDPSLAMLIGESAAPGTVRPQPGFAQSIGSIIPLTPEQIRAQVQQEILDSISAYGSPIHEQRRINLRRYDGKPFGNEVQGQSQAQVSVVQDTIEWMTPSIMKSIFGASGNIWDFRPNSPQEEAGADQASDAVNHIFLEECDGFMKLLEMAKTSLLEKRGYMAIQWEDVTEPQEETFRGVDEDYVGYLASDPNVEVIAFEEHQGEIMIDPQTQMPVRTFDLTVRRRTPIGRIRIDSVAPEHVLMPRGETTLNDDTKFCGYRRKMTVSDLISLGYNPDVIAALPRDERAEFSDGRIERMNDEAYFPSALTDRGDGASRELWVNYVWMRIDEDGDGYAELRRIVCVGDSSINIIEDTQVSHNAMVSVCPIPQPHKFWGNCPGDEAADQQVIQSTLLRQMLDNGYRLNHGRFATVAGAVNLDDLASNKVGMPVRVDFPEAIQPLAQPALPAQSFNLFEFMNQQTERRTGVSSWQQGPDASDMKYANTGVVSNVATASESRINLINTIFAQTGVKDIGKKILRLMCENYAGPFLMRLRGTWTQCDPRSWNANMSCTVKVGLGVGEMEARVQKLMMVRDTQKDLLLNGGAMLVSPKNLYNTAEAIVKCTDIGIRGQFFTDPGENPWPEPKPDFQTQVKFKESDRRAREDENKDNQDTMRVAIKADEQRQLDGFRYAELESKERMEAARLRTQEEVIRLQVAGQLRAAIANRQGATQ